MNFNLLEKKLLALFLHKKEGIMFKVFIFIISCLFIVSSFAQQPQPSKVETKLNASQSETARAFFQKALSGDNISQTDIDNMIQKLNEFKTTKGDSLLPSERRQIESHINYLNNQDISEIDFYHLGIAEDTIHNIESPSPYELRMKAMRLPKTRVLEERLENIEDESQRALIENILTLNDHVSRLRIEVFDLKRDIRDTANHLSALREHSHFYDIPETEQDLTLQRRTSSAELRQSHKSKRRIKASKRKRKVKRTRAIR